MFAFIFSNLSKVIRGNLMVVPIEDTLIYVEPIYLQATQSELPELKRVIFSYGDQIVMSDSLETAVNQIFGYYEEISRRTKIVSDYC